MTGVRAVLLDLDGTLFEDRRPLPGALATVQRLRASGCAVRFVTNTTERSHREVLEDLCRMGFTEDAEELYTAPVVAAKWLRREGIDRVVLLVPPATREDFASLAVDEEHPEAVVAGDLGEAWDFALLNRAFRWLRGGARLVALQKNRYWQREGELVLDAGPFIAALEFAAGVEAVVVGKPSAAFFAVAVDGLGVAAGSVAMVGDDVQNDVGGAQRAGLRGVLVRTGKYRPGDEQGAIVPDFIVDSVADLPDVIR